MKVIQAFAAFSLLGCVALNALAADQAPRNASPLAAACEQDVKALCPEVKSGEGRIGACLKANQEKVSAGCKAAFKSGKRQRHQMQG